MSRSASPVTVSTRWQGAAEAVEFLLTPVVVRRCFRTRVVDACCGVGSGERRVSQKRWRSQRIPGVPSLHHRLGRWVGVGRRGWPSRIQADQAALQATLDGL